MAAAQAGEQMQQHYGIYAAAEGEADVLMRGDVGGDGLGGEGHGGFVKRQPENNRDCTNFQQFKIIVW